MGNARIDIYLASASPRRREILQQLGLHFECLPQQLDESARPGEAAAELVQRLALEKARAALAGLPAGNQTPVLGADTIVCCAGRILGKPADEQQALDMLGLLGGREHQVLTAVALVSHERSGCVITESRVRLKKMLPAEMRAYWHTGEPADKAGAYAVQGLGAIFVESVEGSYSGIVGLPVFETVNLLEKFGITRLKILSPGDSSQDSPV